MTKTLCILFDRQDPAADTEVDWALFDGAKCVSRMRTPLDAIRDYLPDTRGRLHTVAVCSGDAVMTTSVRIPSRQASTLRKALPFMLEEQLACTLEQTHLATAPLGAGDDVHVAVVAHERMIAWIDTLHAAGLPPEAIIPDYLLVPSRPDTFSVLLGGRRTVLRFGEYAGASVTPGMLDSFLDLALAEQADSIRTIEIVSSKGDKFAAEQAVLLEETLQSMSTVPVERVEYAESLVEIVASEAIRSIDSTINLCQGGYSLKLRSQSEPHKLRPAVAGMAAAVLLYLAGTLGLAIFMNGKAERMEEQARALYRDMFPRDQRVVSVRRQMQSHLRSSRDHGGGRFLPLLGQASTALQQTGDRPVRLTQMRYDGDAGALRVEFAAGSMDDVQLLMRQLEGSGTQSRLVSASESDGSVAGQIELGGS